MVLYVVSTPIGNMEDITLRAVRVLGQVSLILAEDTRRTKKLLTAHGIMGKVASYHDHNKEKKTPEIIKQLQEDIPIALVSDAGTPGVSDPGFYLVRACAQSQVPIIPIPGPSAFVAGLVCSGLPTDSFWFHGFFPKKGREKIIRVVQKTLCTHIFYESPHRIEKTLALLADAMPGASVVIGRELTKKFEEFLRGSALELVEQTKEKKWKGELVLLIHPS